MSNDQQPESDPSQDVEQQQADATTSVPAEEASEAERLAKLLEAADGGEADIGEEGSVLSLPDELADAANAEQDGADFASDEIPQATAETEEDGELALPESLKGEAATATPDDAADLGPSWVTNADSSPLLISDGEASDALRKNIQSSIESLGEEEVEETPSAIDLPPQEIRAAVEALLLVSSKPMTEARLVGCLPGASEAYLRGLLEGLEARYDSEYRGWDLRRLAGGWQLLTRPVLHPWVRQLDKTELPTKLSNSAMETLAIVAYKQPVARGGIEDIRGVQCGPMLRQLMDLKLVQVVGRNDDVVGRPLLYGTTPIFLDRFGLGDLSDLPRQHEFGE